MLTYGVTSDGCQRTRRVRACCSRRREQEAGALRAFGCDQRVERLDPLGGLERIGVLAGAGENGADVAGE